jgi:glycosyltransferase involved in cell wall biosynthesis
MRTPTERIPVVSVVIPTFNRAGLIGRAIESCLGQRDAPTMEVIVVDDCSDDDTRDVVARYADRGVRYIRLAENLGGAAARNAGIDAARGRYLAFLDSDDTWRPEKLKRQIAALAQSAAPQQTVCHTQVRIRRQGRDEVVPAEGKAPGETIAHYLFVAGGHMQTSSLLLPCALAKRTLFDPALCKHQDYDFCLRLEENGADFLFVPSPLVDWCHDDRPDRITRRYGAGASVHFLETRRDRFGEAASAAFWVKHILLQEMAGSPLAATAALVKTVTRGSLPLSWYAGWVRDGVSKRVSGRTTPRISAKTSSQA